MLAAAWIGSPRTVLLDEPLEAMDRGMRDDILRWVDRLASSGATLVVATHDIEPFAARAARALTVAGGRCRMYEELPDAGPFRLQYLEALSRGMMMSSTGQGAN